METGDFPPVPFDAARHLSDYQEILGLPRETLPRLTAEATRRALRRAGGALQLDLVETEGVAPIFLLLPSAGAAAVTVHATWHAESRPVTPAAAEGAERLALAAVLASLAALADAGTERASGEPVRAAVVVAPAAGHGSRPLAEALAAHRERLRAQAAVWPRIAAAAPKRRRIFLGSRGQAVLGLWGEGADPYRIRDAVVEALSEEAYGPRPLDFELLRKLAASEEAMDFLDESIEDPGAVAGKEGEARLRSALFDPRARVMTPAARHPDRPAAWIAFETSEGMEAEAIRARVESMAGGTRVEMAEALPWDRIGIHHPAVRAAVLEAKERSAGPEIWPMAPWPTPSGAFTRAVGTPLLEWAIPLPEGGTARRVTPETFDPLVRETTSILRRLGAIARPSAGG